MRTSLAFVVAVLLAAAPARGADPCLSGAFAAADALDIRRIRGWIENACPCAGFDGAPGQNHAAYRRCVRAVLKDAIDGTPIAGLVSLRRECRMTVARTHDASTCGYRPVEDRRPCCEHNVLNNRNSARVKPAARCTSSANGYRIRQACYGAPFVAEACSNDATNSCVEVVLAETIEIPSGAAPAETPGSPGAPVVTNPKLLAQFGTASIDLNRATYTRFHRAGPPAAPEAILVLIPGFEGGAGSFKILAENLILRAHDEGLALEVWGYDRRSNQLEDRAGIRLAASVLHATAALDWLYGAELGLTLDPLLVAGPNRRAVFYDTQADVPFMANWTNLVLSRDIDAVVAAADAAVQNHNVFLGGHSAGTGFTARYAATDFNLTGVGAPDPGYAKVRGLVLLEGGGASTAGAPLTADSLDRIEAKANGGLFHAVRDDAPRCVNGAPCTIATEAVDCAGDTPPKCTPPATAYAVVPGLLNPRILAAAEPGAVQGLTDADSGQVILQVDQGAPGNNAVDVVPDLATLAVIPAATAQAALGRFLDDDGLVASFASFVATSVGANGPVVGGLNTWLGISDGPMPPAVLPNNGPAPTSLPAPRWGQEKEVTEIDRMRDTFLVANANFTDWYFPAAGPGTTSSPGVCTGGTCTAGNVGAACANDGQCAQSINLDSSALSIGRGRRDIENLTQAAAISVPVIAIGGSNGLTPVPGNFVGFASSIGTCTAPSCDGTARVVDASSPNPAFPTFGDVDGGFEVVIAEGFAHVDVVTAEDSPDNPILPALVEFLERNVQ
jgi:pimeloyl-ACP methyl ester carboxylesterase